jgi:hypothetical protein
MMKSEVVRLRHQIELELETMQRAMTGFAMGTARHEFIRLRMDRLGEIQDELAVHVGEADAMKMVCTLYIEAME